MMGDNHKALVERVAEALYTAAQEYNGNLSALPWRIIILGGGQSERWLHFANIAIAALQSIDPTEQTTAQPTPAPPG